MYFNNALQSNTLESVHFYENTRTCLSTEWKAPVVPLPPAPYMGLIDQICLGIMSNSTLIHS